MCAVMMPPRRLDRGAERAPSPPAAGDRADARRAAGRDASRRSCRRARGNACRRRRSPSACRVWMIDPPEPGDVLGAIGQRTIADRRVRRIGEDVEDRRVVERDPDRRQLGGQRAGKTRREPLVAAPPERRHRRPPRERPLQPGDPAALLVDADPERQLLASSWAWREMSATCSGSSTLRANSTTPPRSNSRASDLSSGGIAWPGNPPSPAGRCAVEGRVRALRADYVSIAGAPSSRVQSRPASAPQVPV